MPQTAQTHRIASGAARYTELKIYAALFFVLVASVFVVNFNLANESNRDAERIFCATKQQEYWQRAQRNLYQVKTNLLIGANADSLFEEFSVSVLAFDSTVTALLRGNTIVLGEARVDVAAVQDVRARRIINYINEIWAPRRTTFKRLTESRRLASVSGSVSGRAAGRIDETLLDEAVDYTARFDDPILSNSRAFVVKLGEISTERTNKLQFIQISALTLSLMVFAAMGLRLAVSLRKQDAVIRESQQQLIQSEKMAS
ncbi:MAG: hypothetical protein IAF08_15885, partial [Rhizobacter sp.]|nr:hypothetical protein [Chlorobiales bacterium]